MGKLLWEKFYELSTESGVIEAKIETKMKNLRELSAIFELSTLKLRFIPNLMKIWENHILLIFEHLGNKIEHLGNTYELSTSNLGYILILMEKWKQKFLTDFLLNENEKWKRWQKWGQFLNFWPKNQVIRQFSWKSERKTVFKYFFFRLKVLLGHPRENDNQF